MDKKCKIDGCDNEIYGNFEECVLHCEKHIFEENKEKILKEFYDKLRSYTVDYLLRNEEPEPRKAKESHLLKYFNDDKKFGSQPPLENLIVKYKIDASVIYEGIKFPEIKENDVPDYFNIFGKMSKILFDSCDILFSDIFIRQATEIRFINCSFMNIWEIGPINYFISMNECIYEKCTFKKNVFIQYYRLKDKKQKENRIQNKLFNDCNFENILSLSGYVFSEPLFFNAQQIENCKINFLLIKGCRFEKGFYLNKYKIISFRVFFSEFQDAFEFQDNDVGQLEFDTGTTAYKHANFNNTKFLKFSIRDCKFNDIVSFDDCKFGTKERINQNDNIIEYVTKFEYVTFFSIVSYRNSVFYQGLSLEKVNAKEYMDFLNADVGFQFTNRDTYRRIKDSFDKIENHIEANNYFKHEMEKYRVELKSKKGYFWEKFVFGINKLTSDYGQSYIRPIVLILSAMFIHTIIKIGYQGNWLYGFNVCLDNILCFSSLWLNEFAKSLIPIKSFLNEGFEFTSLLFYLTYVILIYQTVVALKRLTKR